MKSSKKAKGFLVFIILVAVTTASLFFERKVGKFKEDISSSKGGETEVTVSSSSGGVFKSKASKTGKDYIARIFITGAISESTNMYNQKWLLSTIDDLKDDDRNKGIILFINSPGGSVYETDEVYLRLSEYKKTKPVYAYFASMAASGGYYMGCAADYIMANRNTLCGCIGVLCGQFTDLTGLMDKYGIKSETIHAGRNKNMGNYNEPVTDEQRAIMQSIADECYEQFTDIVADSRGINKNTVVDLSDGRLYTARQALKVKLIDSIGSWNDLVDTMKRNEFDGAEYDVSDYEYKKEDSLYSLFMGMSKFRARGQLPESVEKILSSDIKYPAYIYEGALYQ